MEFLDAAKASDYLETIGLKIGNWNELRDASDSSKQAVKQQAPRDARELHNFAQHVASWLPDGRWKLFQIDNSTSPFEDEAYLINRLLFGGSGTDPLPYTLLFDTQKFGLSEDMLLYNLIFLFLLFECHGEITSSNCSDGQYLSLQDGFVYFVSRSDRDAGRAKELVRRFEEDPLRMVEVFTPTPERTQQ